MILDLVSAMGLCDIPEEVASWINGAGLRRKVGGGDRSLRDLGSAI